MAATLQADYPAVQRATILQHQDEVGVRIGDRSLMASGVVEADTSFFEVFGGFRFAQGDRATALRRRMRCAHRKTPPSAFSEMPTRWGARSRWTAKRYA